MSNPTGTANARQPQRESRRNKNLAPIDAYKDIDPNSRLGKELKPNHIDDPEAVNKLRERNFQSKPKGARYVPSTPLKSEETDGLIIVLHGETH